MAFYDLSKEERNQKVNKIFNDIFIAIEKDKFQKIETYSADEDTYIRKTTYQNIGKIYFKYPDLQSNIINKLKQILKNKDEKIRQTTVNAAGEIGIKKFEIVESIFDIALFDEHHSVRNAVIGSVKKMSEKNPIPVLQWAKKYLHHADKEIRREICHGIELRGRTHPQDILPLLKELQFDTTARVRHTLIHVLGQIAYKKNCLETVIQELKTWKNKDLVLKAIDEIIDVHLRYKDFSFYTQEQAIQYIDKNFNTQ